MRVGLNLILHLLVVAVASGFAQGPPDRDARWREDVRFVASELSKKHKNLFFFISQAKFEAGAAALEREIPRLTDREIKVALVRLVASVHDGHTQVWWKTDDFGILPITVYRFSDGWYVVRASKDHARIVGRRLLRIGETDVETAVERMKAFVACDNEPCHTDRVSRYLTVTDFLFAANLIVDRRHATLTFANETGGVFTEKINALENELLKQVEFTSAFDDTKTPVPIYRRNPELNYFREFLPDSKTLYINYRRCVEIEKQPFEPFAAETLAFIDSNDVERIVIDLRQNGGGRESILRPLSIGLHARKKFREKGRVFVVIGRATYSSAANNAFELRAATNALFVGEATGQKPNHYGEVKILTLRNSGVQIGYSSNFFKRADGDPDSIKPDIAAPLSFADYLAGRDVALAAVIAYRDR
jgi:hypothetical protein